MELTEVKTEIPPYVQVKTGHDGKATGKTFSDQPKGIANEKPLTFEDKSNLVKKITRKTKTCLDDNFGRIILCGKVLLFLGYFVYFGFALSCHIGDEGSWRLIGCTILGVWILSWHFLKKTKCYFGWSSLVDKIFVEYPQGKRTLVVRWCLYVAMTTFMVVYVVIFVARKTPENLRSLIGLFGFPFLLFLYSNNKRKVNWHTVYWAMALQFIMALLILKTNWGASVIRWCGKRVESLIGNGAAGSIFVFGKDYRDHNFVFGAMVQVFVLTVFMSVMTYLGVLKYIVETLGRALAFCIGTSPPEGINSIGNMFLHVPESAMLIQEYLLDMTPSQLFVTYAGGLSTVGGAALVIFMSFGVPLAPLVAASAMSAPAALAASKLCFPSHDEEEVPKPTGDAKTIAEMVPFLSMMGARSEDCLFLGELLGVRTFSLAVVAYPKLGPIIQNGVEYRDYIADGANNTWTTVGDDIFLDNLNKTLVGGVIDERSEVIATYALCGSASFAIMGIIIGSFEVIVPHRLGEITENIFRAMVVGTVASYLTACFAGLLFEVGVETY